MTIQPATDMRFRRARVRSPRRRRAVAAVRRGVHLLLLAGAVALGVRWIPEGLERSGLLRIDSVAVQGNRRLSNGEVAALLGPLEGVNILAADLASHRERLLTSGWVKSVALRRRLPSTVEVTVEEREPVGLVRVAGSLYLIDDTGTVIDEYGPGLTDFSLPIVDGLEPRAAWSGPDPEHSRLAGLSVRPGAQQTDGVVYRAERARARARLVGRLTAALRARPDLSERVSQIDVADAHDAVVLLNDDPALLHLGDEQFVERLDRYIELAPTLHARVPEIDYVDLRFERRVYVRPAGG